MEEWEEEHRGVGRGAGRGGEDRRGDRGQGIVCISCSRYKMQDMLFGQTMRYVEFLCQTLLWKISDISWEGPYWAFFEKKQVSSSDLVRYHVRLSLPTCCRYRHETTGFSKLQPDQAVPRAAAGSIRPKISSSKKGGWEDEGRLPASHYPVLVMVPILYAINQAVTCWSNRWFDCLVIFFSRARISLPTTGSASAGLKRLIKSLSSYAISLGRQLGLSSLFHSKSWAARLLWYNCERRRPSPSVTNWRRRRRQRRPCMYVCTRSAGTGPPGLQLTANQSSPEQLHVSYMYIWHLRFFFVSPS